MNGYCPYSGVSYKLQYFGAKTQIIAPHPIFYAKTKFLISQAGNWAAGNSNLNDPNERRLLFLALLYKTAHVTFKTSATPSDSIVQLNMEKLLRFVNWETNVANPQLDYAHIVIKSENHTLENVRHWLEAWWDVKVEWEANSNLAYLRKKVMDKELVLERLMKSAATKNLDYIGRLAEWAFEASEAPKALHAYWKSLFKLKGFDIAKASTVDLEELLEHMEHHLIVYNSPLFASEVLKHVRTLVAKNAAGVEWLLGGATLDNLDKNYTILNEEEEALDDSVEEYNKEIAISKYLPTSLEEPQRQNYESTISYLRAKAAYTLNKSKQSSGPKINDPNSKL